MIRIGTDIALISRFSSLSEHTQERIFTPYELEEAQKRGNKSEYLASRFASKEAYSKARGSGFSSLSPIDIEIHNDDSGAPFILYKGKIAEKTQLSISHDGDYAIAFVLIEE